MNLKVILQKMKTPGNNHKIELSIFSKNQGY
jgi:hypothetical protein